MRAYHLTCMFVIFYMLTFVSCSQKQTTPTLQDTPTQQDVATQQDASTLQDAPKMQDTQTSTIQPDVPTEKEQAKQPQSDKDKLPKETITEKQHQPVQKEDIKVTIRELETKIKDIYFGFDRYDIDEKAEILLKMAADILSTNRKIKVIIEGHCDERGTREYNLGLGDRRANAAKEYLVSLGIPSKRLDTVSYGKEKPQCTEQTEECWAKNRRAHFVFVEDIQ